jgi:hypothetical protein
VAAHMLTFRPPSRILLQTEISRLAAHCPGLAGDPCMRFVSAQENLVLMSLSGVFVSARKIPFPGNGDWFAETQFEISFNCREGPDQLKSVGSLRQGYSPALLG